MALIPAILLLAAAGTGQAEQAAPARSVPAPVQVATPQAAPVLQPAPPITPAPLTSIGFLTAGQLADRCQQPSPADTNYCFAFIAGVHDAIQVYEKWLSTREFCPPTSLAHSELRRSFLTYVSAYPSSRDGVAASVIVVALKQTYPC